MSAIHNPNGGSVVFIETAPFKITVKDIADNSLEQNARVYLLAASGGPLPFQDSITIVRSGSTATVTHTAHGVLDQSSMVIAGSDQPEYNGVKTITVTDANTYTYTVSGTPDTPATGTIVATVRIFSGLTDVNGEIEGEIDFTSSQPISGHARKSSGAGNFKTSNIVGTIASSGLDSTAFLIADE